MATCSRPSSLPRAARGAPTSFGRRVVFLDASQGRTDLVSLWCGQGAPLLSHRDSAELFEALVSGTDRLLRNLAQRKAAAG